MGVTKSVIGGSGSPVARFSEEDIVLEISPKVRFRKFQTQVGNRNFCKLFL